jgi:hypothetical protein
MKIIRPYVKKLERVENKYSSCINLKEAVAKRVNVYPKHIHHIEAESNGKFLSNDMHPLIQATNTSFYDHLPLVLTPDIIWYCISSAVAVYINKHAEDLRKIFVNHQGKKELLIERPDFFLGKHNPWNEVIDQFVEKIEENTNNDIAIHLKADFTTTTKISAVVSEIVIMDAMKQYFHYSVRGGCGIPEIRLSGEKSDWERIKNKVNKLVDIIPKFKEWTKSLNEIIDQFISVFDDKIDKLFWKSIYHCKLNFYKRNKIF